MNITHIPTALELATERSIVIGSFEYPPMHNFDEQAGRPEEEEFDQGAYADRCYEVEQQVRAGVAAALNDHGIDTTEMEVRLSEFTPGEIRLYA